MARKKRTKPVFKVGDWVRLSEYGNKRSAFKSLRGLGPWRITNMHYYVSQEDNPSPWAVDVDLKSEELMDLQAHLFQLWEEHIMLDPFMTACQRAVDSKPQRRSKRNGS